MGRKASFHDVDALVEWLSPHINSPYDISYPTERALKSTVSEVPQSSRYAAIMRGGKTLSDSWSFGTVALLTAVSRIAKVFRGRSSKLLSTPLKGALKAATMGEHPGIIWRFSIPMQGERLHATERDIKLCDDYSISHFSGLQTLCSGQLEGPQVGSRRPA